MRRPRLAAGRQLAAGDSLAYAGFNATTCFCGLNAALGLDTTQE